MQEEEEAMATSHNFFICVLNFFKYAPDTNNNNSNGRNDSCLTWVATSLIEEMRRWPIINASPRGQCSQ